MRKPWKIAACALFLTACLYGALAGDKLLARGEDTRDSLRVFTELVSLAHERYGNEITFRELVFASIQGMLRTLDPHTSFLSPRAYNGMREKQQATFYGLGILISQRNGRLTVITPIEGTPASRMGMRAGDIISTIEGEPTESMSTDDAVDKLKGPKGTEVSIEIVRRGLSEPLKMTITRAEIPQITVRNAYMITPETGYLWLTDFNRSSSEEIARALADLKKQGMKQLIFDLRNNGGGLLDQAIEIGDQFVPDGAAVVETRGRTPDSMQSYRATGRYPSLSMPVVVLVNRGTASAAEIVSGAIQDHDMGLILGTPTWGKGLVQTVFNLPYGAGLALTTAKYYTPAGRLIQRDYTSYYDYVNVGDGVDEAPAHSANDPVFRTDLGREVFGGGGVTPDVLVENELLKPFSQMLLSKNCFLNFAVDYIAKNEVPNRDWRPGPELLDLFRAWLIAENIAPESEVTSGLADAPTASYVVLAATGEVMNARFGQEAQHRVVSQGDQQIQRALALFPQASELLAQRLASKGDAKVRESVERP